MSCSTSAHIIGPLAGIGRALEILPESWFKRPGENEADRNDAGMRASGFEAAEATYKRITLASRLVGGFEGKKPEEITAENTARTNEKLDELNGMVRTRAGVLR
jgi:hypothetical protein